MKARCLLFALGAAWPALACSCASYEPVKACQIYQSTPVIFRGRVIDDNHDPTAGFGQMTLYRFKVLETFKGISPDTNEVFIDPASMTSCYTEFSPDNDYLVYTGGREPVPAAVTILRGRQSNSPAKQMPEAWKGLEQLPVYTVGVCSPTRTVEEGDADLTFLRAYAKDGAKGNGWIEGRTVQNFSYPYRFANFVAAADAIVTATAAAGNRKTTPVRRLQRGPKHQCSTCARVTSHPVPRQQIILHQSLPRRARKIHSILPQPSPPSAPFKTHSWTVP